MSFNDKLKFYLGLLLTVFVLLNTNNKALAAVYDNKESTELNTLTAPINTPNSINNNLEQLKEFSRDVNSAPKEKQEDPQNIIPAVDHSKNESLKTEMSAVFITRVDFGKSAIFSNTDLDEFSKTLVDKKVSDKDINDLINTINISYRKKGYITAKAYLPPQELQGGVIKIEFIEGRIGEIIVQKNKYTKKQYIIDKLEEKPGDLFELKILQNDVNNFNSTNDNIKIVPGLKPGKEVGTTDVYLNAKEGFPFHLSPSFDNFGRDSVGLHRGGIVLSHDSLFGYQDRLTSGIYLGRSSVSNFEDYNFPIFNKGTRIGGTFSYSNVSVTAGTFANADIKGDTFLYSLYAQQPILRKSNFELSTSLSTNFKNSTTDMMGISPYTKLDDKSLAASIYARYTYKNGMIYTSHTYTNGIMKDAMNRDTKWFTKYEGNITDIHNFKYGITNIFKSSVQFTPQQLKSLEQYQLGGMGTVRGFSEGLILGNNGYLFSEEILFPIPVLPKKVFNYKLRDNVRLAAFVDHGAAFPFKDARAASNDFLTSAGCGLRIRLTRFLTARTYFGFGFNSVHHGEPSSRFHFDLVSYPF